MVKSIRYKKNYEVELSDLDFKGRLRLSSLFTYFQDVANLAADELGVGIEKLYNDYGIVWVLTRIRVDVERYPTLNEQIIIETWPQEPGKIEFERDFLVRDQQGNVIIRAMSSWVLMDIKERKLRRTSQIDLTYPEIIEDRAIHSKFKKLKDFGNLNHTYHKVISYSDIDFNGHLTNSKYVDYILDCLDMDLHKQFDVSSIEVNFVNEALPGETISLLKDDSLIKEGKVYIEGQIQNKTTFKSELMLKENK